jgi:DNA-binding protein H-NS
MQAKYGPNPMTTLSELKSELVKVDQLLYATWLQEREAARRRITELAVEFQISAATVLRDVEAALLSAQPTSSALRPPTVELPLRKLGAPANAATQYRNPATGETWGGRGPRPRWLREALDAGRQLEDFRATVPSAPTAAPDPLREFEDAARRAPARTA